MDASQHQRPFEESIERRDFASIEGLVRAGVDLNRPDQDGCFPLLDPIQNNDLKMVEFLIRLGADVNALGLVGGGYEMETEMLELLLRHGFDLSRRDLDGYTAIHWEFFYGKRRPAEDPESKFDHYCRKLKIYQAVGLDFNDRENKRGLSPLHLIISECIDPPYLGPLLECGAKPDWPDRTGSETPFHLAASTVIPAELGLQYLQLMLAKSTCNINVQGEDGLTPLHDAVRADLARADLLLKAGADPNALDDWGRTPLFYAIIEFLLIKYTDARRTIESAWAMIPMLLKYGAKTDYRIGKAKEMTMLEALRDYFQRRGRCFEIPPEIVRLLN